MKSLTFNLFLLGFLIGLLFSLFVSAFIDKDYVSVIERINKLNKACATVESEPFLFDAREVQCKNGAHLNYYKLEQDNE